MPYKFIFLKNIWLVDHSFGLNFSFTVTNLNGDLEVKNKVLKNPLNE